MERCKKKRFNSKDFLSWDLYFIFYNIPACLRRASCIASQDVHVLNWTMTQLCAKPINHCIVE